ncbi:unnamed protein product, partial [Phaeothamnion confervicola]
MKMQTQDNWDALRPRVVKPPGHGRIVVWDEVVQMNSRAMASLKNGDAKSCRRLLTQALQLAQGSESAAELEILTCNNMACLYRRSGELQEALEWLRRALALSAAEGVTDNVAVTHLNVCAVLSQLRRHAAALEHAQAAVYFAQDEISRVVPPRHGLGDGTGGLIGDGGGGGGNGGEPEPWQGHLVTLAVAYYNLAVELEHAGNADLSLQWYRKAIDLVKRSGLDNGGLLRVLQTSYAAAWTNFKCRGTRSPASRAAARGGHPPPLSRSPQVRGGRHHASSAAAADVRGALLQSNRWGTGQLS